MLDRTPENTPSASPKSERKAEPNVFEPPRIFEAPQPGRALQEEPVALEAVGFAKRALARGLDWFLFRFTSAFLFGLVTHDRDASLDGLGRVLLFNASLIFSFVVFESLGGGTPAKLLFGLRVVREDGRPCDVAGSIVRNLAFYVDGLFFGLIAYFAISGSPQGQRHGDHWAKTMVVRAESVPSPSRRGVLNILLAFFLVLAGNALLALLFR